MALALLIQEGYLGEGFIELLGKMLASVSALSAGVRTVDRFSEKVGNGK